MLDSTTDRFQDIRDAIRALCAGFPAEYHRKVDQERGYPEAFVAALTRAGWMAALIPEEYGGSGLGLTEASVIMEEINRAASSVGDDSAHTHQRPSVGPASRRVPPDRRHGPARNPG
ncbi:MAG: acyl-CoA dehydrogenase family protein [Geminicoccaceae bacterium]